MAINETMSLETARQLSVEDRIKSRIATLTGLPDPTIISLDNRVATRHFFQEEAKKLYESVDRVVAVARKIGVVKK